MSMIFLPRRQIPSLRRLSLLRLSLLHLPQFFPARETLTEEERKARNRRYAKKSRDRKTRRYQDALTLNKDLESQIAALQEENTMLRSRNSKMDAELRGYKTRLEQALQRIELASSLTRRSR